LTEIEFKPWPKIMRLFRNMTVTEKIDGTNAAIGITQLKPGEHWEAGKTAQIAWSEDGETGYAVYAQSRKRLITPDDDNFGFAKWVNDNAEDLISILGTGLHYGEWWGNGIQRSYGLANGDKRFSLFNVNRFGWMDIPEARAAHKVPGALHVVPVIVQNTMDTEVVRMAMDNLKQHGSYAAPGYMNPEGIVVYHHAANALWKVTYEFDEKGKGAE
jgi:hypothetical protein